MRFVEDWFGWPSQIVLASLARSTEGVDGAVVEVGCWEGRSTIALANAVAPATVLAVDTWQGSPVDGSDLLAAERDVFAAFTANIAEGTPGNVQPVRSGWRQVFADWSGPIRFLHIDAEHTYTEVRDNIEAALPWVQSGGIVCGDDQHHEPVITAVRDVLGDVATTATLWVWRKP